MRFEVRSRLQPASVLQRARSFFGSDGLGLKADTEGDDFITFEGGGGVVLVSAEGREGGSTVEVSSREWDHAVERFLRSIT